MVRNRQGECGTKLVQGPCNLPMARLRRVPAQLPRGRCRSAVLPLEPNFLIGFNFWGIGRFGPRRIRAIRSVGPVCSGGVLAKTSKPPATVLTLY